ncbi:MAG: hypothetical protein EAZ92_16235 [Candidatus Kapaibacterium sp.]|nr:MAG: hypothetical protein EAZ92_16235 [Candidatus Kapabacteria bacterium]
METLSFVEFVQMYNGFAKRGTIVSLGEGALRRLADWNTEGYSLLPAIIIRAFQQVQEEPFQSGAKMTLQIAAPLRFNGIDAEKQFTVLCYYVSEFRYFFVSMISEQ